VVIDERSICVEGDGATPSQLGALFVCAPGGRSSRRGHVSTLELLKIDLSVRDWAPGATSE